MKITDLKEHPINPRLIRDKRFKDLIKSLIQFPKMLPYSPIKYYPETMEVLAGNMRTRALRYLHECTQEELTQFIETAKDTSLPIEINEELWYEFWNDGEIWTDWTLPVVDLTEFERRQLMIKDNIPYGEPDWDILKEEWSDMDLVEMGMEEAAWTEDNMENIFDDKGPGRAPSLKIELKYDDGTFFNVKEGLAKIADDPADAVVILLNNWHGN